MTVITLPPDEAVTAAVRRDAYLTGLRALERLLSRVSIPVPNYADTYFARGTDEEILAEVARIARALGVEPVVNASGHYTAEVELGGGVLYRAIAIPAAARKPPQAVAA